VTTRHPQRPLMRLLAATLLVVLAASCSDSDKGDSGDQSGDGGSATASDTAKNCPGEPLKFMTIGSLTGTPTGTTNAGRARIGTDAALAQINGDCSLGRPVEVTTCDDTFDVNGSLACGRKAKEDGTLAILSSVGSFDDGAAASGLPGIFLLGTGAFDLTDEQAYSSVSGVTIGIGGVSAAKAAGAKTFLLVLPDTPQLQFVSNMVESAGEQLDIEVETLYLPMDTTDFAPVAAQIAERDADAIGLLPSAPVPMINALTAEGITPDKQTMSIASIALTPEIVDELGDALNGMIVVAPTAPPTETKNPGIAEFRAALEANGQDPDDELIDFNTVLSWSNLKKLEGALLAAGPTVIESLDSQSLVDAVVANPIARPEQAPYDFRTHQLPEFPELASFRIYTRDVAILELNDGKYDALADGFVDVLDPPSLDK
jgi:ABC-type branched-subunit amino acid transport system substrate-binding protein